MTGPYAYRDADGDVDLGEALGPHLRHYVTIMVSGERGTRRQVLATGGMETPHGMLLRHGFGRPTRASACGELAVQPGWSWDVCGYYVLLGVRWTATKGEIRRAYIAACARRGGQVQDERLTYVMAQLSDERVRRAYDMTPLGGVFTWDRDVEMRLKRAAAAEASRRTAQGEAATTEDVLSEMGLRDPEEPGEAAGDEEPGERPEAPPAAPRSHWGAQWGYYLLAARPGDPGPDPVLLEAWQGMVAAALREAGVTAAFAVGQGGTGAPMVLQDVKEACIFVVTEKGASPEKAREAVQMGISLGIVTHNSDGGI